MNKKEKAPQKTDQVPSEGGNKEARLNQIDTEINRYKKIKEKESKKNRNEIQKEIDRLNNERKRIEEIRREISSSFENNNQATDSNDGTVNSGVETTPTNKEEVNSSNFLKFKLIGKMGIGGKISSGIRKILSPRVNEGIITAEDGKGEIVATDSPENISETNPETDTASTNLDTTIIDPENETTENPTATSPEITTPSVNENESQTTDSNDGTVNSGVETTPTNKKDGETDPQNNQTPENTNGPETMNNETKDNSEGEDTDTTTNNPENSNTTNPEATTTRVNGGENGEWDNRQPRVSPEMIMPFFEPQNSEFFNSMSRKAKGVMTSAYEGIYQIPGVNKLVGKMEIAYNQFWIDRKQQKASELKDRYDSLDLKNQFIDQARDEMERTSQMLAENGFSGAGNMAMRADKMQRKQIEIENKKDRLQIRIEKRENRIKLFTNARDAIADRLITHYERKLSPIESKLEALKEKQNEVELFCIGTDVRIDEQYARIKQLEEVKGRMEKSFIDMEVSDREILRDNAMKELSEQIDNLYRNVRDQKTQNEKRRNSINKKVAKIEEKAAPYRDKKDVFVRIKDRRPIDFKLGEREEIREFRGSEQTESHPRIENRNRYYYGGGSDYESEETGYDYRESSFENMENISSSIAKYNTYIETNPNKNHLKINEQELLRATRIFGSTQMTIENFKRLISQYYKAKKIPEAEYIQIINNYKK